MPSTHEPIIQCRAAQLSDAAAIAAIYAPIVRDTCISFEVEPPDSDVVRQRIRAGAAVYPWLVAELEGVVVGYAYASKHRERAAYRWSVDVSAYVSERVRGVGIGRALYERLLKILRQQGFRAVFAGIALPNPASVRLHEAVGFTAVGVYREVGFKLGHWRDVGWWQLKLSADDAPPAEPIAFAALRPPVL
jgi:L-amino acid N-acyltransferase YncA